MSRKQLDRAERRIGPAGDDTGCPILHVDMDAFFASVELLDHPELKGRPVIVGGGNRGVVLSATYEARAFGIHAAMPTSQARRLCPQGVFLPAHHEKYRAASKAVFSIFESITPVVEPLSVDEAFLDVAGAHRLIGSPLEVARTVRRRVHAETRLTCSVGVASNKFLAKLASTHSKPDGLAVVPRDQVLAFLHPLPISALWGVGQRTEERLRRLGLRTVGDLSATPLSTVQQAVGEAVGAHLKELADGHDDRSVVTGGGERSIGAEHTAPADLDDPVLVRAELLRLSERVAARARRAGHVGRVVAIKIRYADFRTITRSRTLAEPTDLARDLYATALELYTALGAERARIRLVGVRLEHLSAASDHAPQLAFDEPEQGWREAEAVVDAAAARFGPDAIRKARFVDPGPG